MKIAFIFVIYKTPKQEIERLKREVKNIGFSDYKLYFVDNTNSNRGYAKAVNEGIKHGLTDKCEIFVNANPDISFKNLKSEDFLSGVKHFDIWGLAMKQDNKIYYGGEIDRWRLSGGLITKKPEKDFIECDFVSGSLMMVKKEVIDKIGLRNEDFFVYYEDVEYCYRAKKAGFKIGINSAKSYIHLEESNKSNTRKNEDLFTARLLFFLKYSDFRQKIRELIRSPLTIIEDRKVIVSLIKSRSFFVSFLSLNISSIFNKFLSFLLFLVFTRNMTPQAYGIYTLVWAQVGLLAPFTDFGTTSYGLVYLPGKMKEHLSQLFSLRLFLTAIVFFATIIISFIFHYQSLVVFYIVLTSISLFSSAFSGNYLIINSIENKAYKSSLVSIMFNLVLIASLIGSILMFKNLTPFFIVLFLCYVGYGIVTWQLVKKATSYIRFSVDIKTWLPIVKKSYVFVLISFFAGLYFKVDVFLLKALKSEAEVGVYSAGYKFLEALMLIPASYNITSTPIFAKLAQTEPLKLWKRIKRDAIYLGTGGMTIALCAFVLSPVILPWLLKGNFQSSIAVLQIVIFALPLIMLSSILLNSLYVMGKAFYVIFVFAFQVIINFALNWFFIPRYSYIASSYITVFSEVCNLVILFVLFRYVYKKRQS